MTPEAREVPPFEVKKHGGNAYTVHGCRCAICLQAHREKSQRELARYREASHANKAAAHAAAAKRARRG